jgi:alpha,alpha-trehalase
VEEVGLCSSTHLSPVPLSRQLPTLWQWSRSNITFSRLHLQNSVASNFGQPPRPSLAAHPPPRFQTMILKYSQVVVLSAIVCSTTFAQSTTSSISQSASVSTAIPSPTGASSAPLPSQAPLPPKQAWCPSEIFCAGEILQAINSAHPYSDSKTIVDKPTAKTFNVTIAAFQNFTSGGLTFGEITQFLDDYFQGEGLELRAVSLDDFPQNPASISAIPDRYVQQFLLAVHQVWNLLIRETNQTALCTGKKCESTLIPLNHTFVVPGGRFREQCEYRRARPFSHSPSPVDYWDSKFILDGLLESELYDVANSTLQNFMDEIERFGFIPNGGRIYYLDRSQPPFFINVRTSPHLKSYH